MGTWGHRAFENDGASDWAWKLKDDGLFAIEAALDAVLSGADAPEAPECENAVAAAALCVLIGKPGGPVPEDVTKWAACEKQRPSTALVGKARKSLARVLQDSELKDLWAESDESEAWQADVTAIQQRLPEGNLPDQPPARPWWKVW